MTRPWYRDVLVVTADKYDLAPNLVEAITWQESGGRPSAFRFEPMFYATYIKPNPKYNRMDPGRVASSYGLMQLMYTTAVEHGFTQEPEYLFVVDINLEFGCKVLAGLMAWANGNITQAVQAYNGGRGAWDRPMPRRYGVEVLGFFAKIEAREKGV